MRALTPRRLAALTVTAAVLLTGCGGAGSGPASAGDPPLSKRSATSGPVQVTVTPRSLDSRGATFDIELDNHQIDLTGDYATTSTLTIGGTPWASPVWTGDAAGSHHRTGRLTFRSTGPVTEPVVLRIGGLPQPVTLRW